MELKEANENLKLLLNTAEKKYVHLTTVNTELQKRIDLIEQQSRIQNDSVQVARMMFYISSINMRPTRKEERSDSLNDEDTDETPLLPRHVFF